jgi:uncharacterized phage protein (TIGR01671 family)
MNREIKFRGQNRSNKKWVYGSLIIFSNDITDMVTEERDKQTGWNKFNVIPDTVGQFIGRKDEDGKDIYEGDILCGKWIGADRKATVVFIPEICSFGIRYLERSTETACINSFWFDTGTDNVICKVIGNIHDNPELLTLLEKEQ